MSDESKVILLVEDNPDDAALARAFKPSHFLNPITVARDGIEALDFLFARSVYVDRASAPLSTLTILDLKLLRFDGLSVLKAIRADAWTLLLPVVNLISSKEQQDPLAGYSLGVDRYGRKPVDFAEFVDAVKVLGIYWLMMNQGPPERPGP